MVGYLAGLKITPAVPPHEKQQSANLRLRRAFLAADSQPQKHPKASNYENILTP